MSDTTQDSVAVTLQEVENQPLRRAYIVTAETGIFKNGKLYEQGEEIMLDDHTATNFGNLNEVEAVV